MDAAAAVQVHVRGLVDGLRAALAAFPEQSTVACDHHAVMTHEEEAWSLIQQAATSRVESLESGLRIVELKQPLLQRFLSTPSP